MASVGLPAVVQVSTCAVCSTRGTNFYEVCDGSEGVVDKICPDCNGDEAVRKHLSDPEGLCPLCESNRLLPRPTLRRRTGIFAGVAASAFQIKLTRQRRKKKELERQMAHAEATSRLSIMYDDPTKWRPVQHNPVLAFAKRYRPQDWELAAANRRAQLPQARVVLNSIIRDVYARLLYLSTIANRRLPRSADGHGGNPERGASATPDDAGSHASDSTGAKEEEASAGLTVADIVMELHKTHVGLKSLQDARLHEMCRQVLANEHGSVRVDLFGRLIGVVEPDKYTASASYIMLHLLRSLYTPKTLRQALETFSSQPLIRRSLFWKALASLFDTSPQWRFDHLRGVCPQKRVPHPWTQDSKQRLYDGITALVQHLPVSKNGMPVPVVAADEGLHFVIAFWTDLDATTKAALDKSLALQQDLRRTEAARIITSWENNRRLQIKVAKKRNRMGPEERDALKKAVKEHGQDFRLIVQKYKWARARTQAELRRWWRVVRLSEKAAPAKRLPVLAWEDWDWGEQWEWGGLQLDPNAPVSVSPTNPHVTASYPRPPWQEIRVDSNSAQERGLIPQAVLELLRNAALPPRRLTKTGVSRRKRALQREKERKQKREQRFLARQSRTNTPTAHMIRSPISSHSSTPTARGAVTRSSVVSKHHHSRTHRTLNARSRTAKSFRKAAGLRLVDTHTHQDVDTSSSSSSSSSSDDEGDLPELGALRAQQKEGVALRGTLKARTPGNADSARKSQAEAARICKAKILQRLTINQRKRRARLKFRLLQGITQPTPVPQDAQSDSGEALAKRPPGYRGTLMARASLGFGPGFSMHNLEDIFNQVDHPEPMPAADWEGGDELPQHYQHHNALDGSDPRLKRTDTPLRGLRSVMAQRRASVHAAEEEPAAPPTPPSFGTTTLPRVMTPLPDSHWTRVRAASPDPRPGKSLWATTSGEGLKIAARNHDDRPSPLRMTRGSRASERGSYGAAADQSPQTQRAVNFANYAAGDSGVAALAHALSRSALGVVPPGGAAAPSANGALLAASHSLPGLGHTLAVDRAGGLAPAFAPAEPTPESEYRSRSMLAPPPPPVPARFLDSRGGATERCLMLAGSPAFSVIESSGGTSDAASTTRTGPNRLTPRSSRTQRHGSAAGRRDSDNERGAADSARRSPAATPTPTFALPASARMSASVFGSGSDRGTPALGTGPSQPSQVSSLRPPNVMAPIPGVPDIEIERVGRFGDLASAFPWAEAPAFDGARTVKPGQAAAAAGVLPSVPHAQVSTLVLRGNNMRGSGCTAVAEAMTGQSSLECLDLAHNRVGRAGAAALSRMLGHPQCTVRVLNLQDNRLGVSGVAALLPGMRTCESLVSLHLGGNSLSRVAGAVNDLLASRCGVRLQHLDLSWNIFRGTAGVELCGLVLTQCVALRALSLEFTGLTVEACQALGPHLAAHEAMVELSVAHNSVGPGLVDAVREGIELCPTLQTVDLRGNNAGTSAAWDSIHAAQSARDERLISRLCREQAQADFDAAVRDHKHSVEARRRAQLAAGSDSDEDDLPALLPRPTGGPLPPERYEEQVRALMRDSIGLAVLLEEPVVVASPDRQVPSHLAGFGRALHSKYAAERKLRRAHEAKKAKKKGKGGKKKKKKG